MKVSADSARALAAIHAESFGEQAWSAEELSRLLLRPVCLGYAAQEQGGKEDLLGFLLLDVVETEAELLTLAVRERDRGRGVGSAVLQQALSLLRNRPVHVLFLEVAVDNLPALRLYQKFGFERVHQRKGYYDRGNGVRVDGVTLRLPLLEP